MTKKFLLIIIAILMCLSVSVCTANQYFANEFRGIKLGDTMDNVRALYPTVVKDDSVNNASVEAYFVRVGDDYYTEVAGFKALSMARVLNIKNKIGAITIFFDCDNAHFKLLVDSLSLRYGAYGLSPDGTSVMWNFPNSLAFLNLPNSSNECAFWMISSEAAMFGFQHFNTQANQGW